MESGIIGLPLSGKTTIFNSLTGQSAQTSDYAGGKKETNLAEIAVPDKRIDELTKIFKPKRTIYATVLVKDIAVEFTEQGGIAPSSMAEMRNSDVLTIVIRAFKDESVLHPLDKVDPLKDFIKVMESMIFSDYAICENRMARLVKESKKDNNEYKILEKIRDILEEDKLPAQDLLHPDEAKIISNFGFLTLKPLIVIANTGEENTAIDSLEARLKELGVTFFAIRGDSEMEIAQLSAEDQVEFLKDLGLAEPAKNRYLQRVYENLNLISFMTVGEDEVRAWSVTKGSSAPQAAGKIHSDLEKGFIRAEVIESAAMLELGSMAEVKKNNKLRLEGKSYIVKDGDILNIRFNV
ncbi:MAG: redox-regulated ATPase YchF [Spirochaetales bacterium]|nr:redox-regulated ATPase YchF [Spirochaetales bacterium]